jgi:hypothetical protein
VENVAEYACSFIGDGVLVCKKQTLKRKLVGFHSSGMLRFERPSC